MFGSSTPSQQSSKTVFPTKFLNQATKYFGPTPAYNPKYVGFSPADISKMTALDYSTRANQLGQAKDVQTKQLNEELSNSGLLTSPAQYMAGGAKDQLNQNYANALETASNQAQLAGLGLTQEEAARGTTFNENTAAQQLQRWLAQMGIATTAGKQETATGPSEWGFKWGI